MKADVNLLFLLDSAKAIAKSDYKVAKAIGTTPQRLSDWRAGRVPCPPEFQALLASIAGFDPQQTAIRALVERHEGTALGDNLMRVLGKPLLATGVALVSAGANAQPIFGPITKAVMQCIEWTISLMSNRGHPDQCGNLLAPSTSAAHLAA